MLASEAAECAGAQGKYWEMHAKLFANPSEWDGGSSRQAQASFQRYAEVIGLDGAAFQDCMTSQQFAAEVQGDFDEARALGITATPAFIINNELYMGARPFEQFSALLDSQLVGQ